MIKISDYIKNFIEDNIHLIEYNDWNTLADRCDDRYLKELVTYLTLAEIPAVFDPIEYSSDTWVATYYSGTSSIISTIEVMQLKDIKLRDGDKINVVLEHTKGPTTIIFKDNKYLNFKRYQVNDTKIIDKEIRKAKIISIREEEIKHLREMIENILTTNKLSYTEDTGDRFYIQLDDLTSLRLIPRYESNRPSYPAYIEVSLTRESPFIHRVINFHALTGSASDLKAEINEFISKTNTLHNSDIALI